MKVLLLIPFLILAGPLNVRMDQPHEVVLTAAQVNSALDIEQAIKNATAEGARPGVVTLDARSGAFVYDHADRSINIFYSHVTLRSLNGAEIANCGDGVFFDDFSLTDVRIEGITFRCEGDGIADVLGALPSRDVAILDNTIVTGRVGVSVVHGDRWKIAGNDITAATGIRLAETAGTRLLENHVAGVIGADLSGADGNQLIGNRITAPGPGVQLRDGSDGNKVIANVIREVRSVGVSVDSGSTGNKVHGNRVTCAAGYACVPTDDLSSGRGNKNSCPSGDCSPKAGKKK
jgi:nitrous oxidase accessory protein NosD